MDRGSASYLGWALSFSADFASDDEIELRVDFVLFQGGAHSHTNIVMALWWYPDHAPRATAHKTAHHRAFTQCPGETWAACQPLRVSLTWAKCFSSWTVLNSMKTQLVRYQRLLPFPSMPQPDLLSSTQKSPGSSLPVWHISPLYYLFLVISISLLNTTEIQKSWRKLKLNTETPVTGKRSANSRWL